jgi:tRNA (guanine-N7-)-methyltransferase
VEIGCGLGEFLTRTATASPEKNFVGIELEWKRLVKTLRKVESSGLNNVRVFRLDAVVVFERLFAPRSIAKVYCLFPCPWPKKKHTKHRLFSRNFLRLLNSRLASGGELLLVTDHYPYVEWIRGQLRSTGLELAERKIAPQFDTKFERKWTAGGQREFFEMYFKKKRHIDVPLKEDAAVRKFYEKDFSADRFHVQDHKGEVIVISKDFLFDEKRKRAMVNLLVSEENLTQNVWISIAKAGDRWRISLPRGGIVFPTAGINKALELVAQAVRKTAKVQS